MLCSIELHTCCEPHFSGHETQLHDGELRQLQFVHSGHSVVASLPEEHDVICGVSICRDYKVGDVITSSVLWSLGILKTLSYEVEVNSEVIIVSNCDNPNEVNKCVIVIGKYGI